MERETMRSITAWLLLASVHQEPVPSQVTAAGSCAHVTRPGTTPRGTPIGESVGSNKEDPMPLAAAIERANCRRVISILSYSSTREILGALLWTNRDTIAGEPIHYSIFRKFKLMQTTLVKVKGSGVIR